MFSARVKCLSSELRIPPFILFISNELLKTYTLWRTVNEGEEFLSFRHVGFFKFEHPEQTFFYLFRVTNVFEK
jgi:hypothetical protein